MREFIALRAKARERMDLAVAAAKREYEATLLAIANLEQDLVGRESSRHKMISTSINNVLPRDRTFTVVDIVTSLEAVDPTRHWRKRSVDCHISRLREMGILRRIKKSQGREPAVYAVADLDVPRLPFEGLTLGQSVAKVLVRPMSAIEVTVALIEQGHHTTMKKPYLRNAVEQELRHGAFKRVGGKWERA